MVPHMIPTPNLDQICHPECYDTKISKDLEPVRLTSQLSFIYIMGLPKPPLSSYGFGVRPILRNEQLTTPPLPQTVAVRPRVFQTPWIAPAVSAKPGILAAVEVTCDASLVR